MRISIWISYWTTCFLTQLCRRSEARALVWVKQKDGLECIENFGRVMNNHWCGMLTWRMAPLNAELSTKGVMFKRPRASGHMVALFPVEVYKAIRLNQYGGVASKLAWTLEQRGVFQKRIHVIGSDHLLHSNLVDAVASMTPERCCVDMLAVSLAGLICLCAR